MKKKIRNTIIGITLTATTLCTLTVGADSSGGGTGVSADKTTNTVTYNAKNEVTDGTYMEPVSSDQFKYFAGWSISGTPYHINATPNDPTNNSLNSIDNEQTIHAYAQWKDRPYPMPDNTNKQWCIKRFTDDPLFTTSFHHATKEEYENADSPQKMDLTTDTYINNVDLSQIQPQDEALPVYFWIKDGTLYYYTEDTNIYLPCDCIGLFAGKKQLTNIEFNYDTDNEERALKAFEYNLNNRFWNKNTFGGFIPFYISSTERMFSGCANLETIDFSGWNRLKDMTGYESGITPYLTNMANMFINCTSLKSLDLTCFDVHNVTNFSVMFGDCRSLGSLDISGWDMRKAGNTTFYFVAGVPTSVTLHYTVLPRNCSRMFHTCQGGEINAEYADTSNVTNMREMFCECFYMKKIDLTGWNTSNVTDMSSMFASSLSIETLDLGSFNTSKVTNMQWMFAGCSGLIHLDLSNFDTSNVTNMQQMFYGCNKLETLDISGWNLEKVENIGGLLYGCSALKTITMKNCSDETVSKIETALSEAGISDNITIVR